MRKQVSALKKLEMVAVKIRASFGSKDAAREKCLKACREIIRLSSNSIRATHRSEKAEAAKLLKSASNVIAALQSDFQSEHLELLQSNFVHDAYKEYAEASITFGVLFEDSLPDPDDLRISHASYLNGLAESVGEMRRYLIDGLRRGDYAASEHLLNIMDNIYTVLTTIDFPDAITYGLRRNTDNVRGILEKTRGDLTLMQQNNVLRQRIDLLSQKLRNSAE